MDNRLGFVATLSSQDRQEYIEYHKQKGDRHFRQEEYEQAIDIYKLLNDQLVATRLASCYHNSGNFKEAEKYYDMAISMDPSPLRYLQRAYFYATSDQLSKAKEAYNELTTARIPRSLIPEMQHLQEILEEEEDVPQIGIVKRIYFIFTNLLRTIFGCRKRKVSQNSSEESNNEEDEDYEEP